MRKQTKMQTQKTAGQTIILESKNRQREAKCRSFYRGVKKAQKESPKRNPQPHFEWQSAVRTKPRQ